MISNLRLPSSGGLAFIGPSLLPVLAALVWWPSLLRSLFLMVCVLDVLGFHGWVVVTILWGHKVGPVSGRGETMLMSPSIFMLGRAQNSKNGGKLAKERVETEAQKDHVMIDCPM